MFQNILRLSSLQCIALLVTAVLCLFVNTCELATKLLQPLHRRSFVQETTKLISTPHRELNGKTSQLKSLLCHCITNALAETQLKSSTAQSLNGAQLQSFLRLHIISLSHILVVKHVSLISHNCSSANALALGIVLKAFL